MNKFLKEQRLKANLTKFEAAKKLGVPTNLITAWESGRSTPENWHLDKLGLLYCVPPEIIVAQIDIFSSKNNDDIFSKALYGKIDTIGNEINLNYLDLELSDLDIRVLIAVYLTSSLGVSPYHELNNLITDSFELHSIINHLTKSNLLEYCTTKGFLCVSKLGAIVLDIIEQEGLYDGFCFKKRSILDEGVSIHDLF